MNVRFRRAERKDAGAAVPLIYASGPDAFEYVFHDDKKGGATDFIAFAFLRKGNELGFDNHLVVEIEGEVTGIGACHSGSLQWRFTLGMVSAILAFYGLFRGLGVMWRGLRFERMVRPPARREFAVTHLGVAESLRGKGIGSRLIHQLIINARPVPPAVFVLDVSDINPKAKALYERLGFRAVRHRASNLRRKTASGKSIVVPGHTRMELVIRKK